MLWGIGGGGGGGAKTKREKEWDNNICKTAQNTKGYIVFFFLCGHLGEKMAKEKF